MLLALFILPSLRSGPHDLPIGVVNGSPSISSVLTDVAGDDYAVQEFDSRADLLAAISDREVVGGLVVEDTGIVVAVASAGSTAISGALSQTGTAVARAVDLPPTITDVVPLPEDDPTGIGLGGLTFPLVFGGIVPVVAFGAMFPRSDRWKLAGLATFSVAGGLIVAAVLRFWFGSIEDTFWPVAGAMALGIAAMSFILGGLQKAFGNPGFTAGAMVMMFLGNPLAGISTTSAWLPAGLGTFGQILPPGSTGTLVRSGAYFDGAGGTASALVLATWILAGLVLHAVGSRRATTSS